MHAGLGFGHGSEHSRYSSWKLDKPISVVTEGTHVFDQIRQKLSPKSVKQVK